MRIDVISEGTISQQARTYAEYRVFAALTQCAEADKVGRVQVLLRPVKLESDCECIACAVTVALDGSDSFRIRTIGPHAYAAINRAVERMRTNAASGLVDRVSRAAPFRLSRGFQSEIAHPHGNVDNAPVST